MSWGDLQIDAACIGIIGHSFGGWTALAATEAEPRIGAVVALAPGGASQTRPGILPLTLAFRWGRDVPALYLVAEGDTMLPLSGMYELFERTPSTKKMIILSRADHLHFMDQVEQRHEAFRTMPDAGILSAIQQEMRPMAELCSEEHAHLFVRGLTLCHMDAFLKRKEPAQALLNGNIDAELACRDVEARSTGKVP
jgi:pimeloyl-ACP methyl ester carboxylesterase